jgi:hypothetical protein
MKTVILSLVLLSIIPCRAESEELPLRNMFVATAKLQFNAKVKFSGVGEALFPSKPGIQNSVLVNREYDDGYVRIDSENNSKGLTWNWGYQNPAQVGGDELKFQSVAVLPGQRSVECADPAVGFDLGWLREVHAAKTWAIGVRAGFGHTSLDARDGGSVKTAVTTTTDTYQLGGVIPPGDGGLSSWQYQGTKQGPGPLIPSTPAHRDLNVAAGFATTAGSRSYEADLYLNRVGLWWRHDLIGPVGFQVGSGVAVYVVDCEYQYDEVTSIPAGIRFKNSGRGGGADAVFGGYFDGALNVDLTRHTSFLLGAEVLMAPGVSHAWGGRRVELQLGANVVFYTGIAISF